MTQGKKTSKYNKKKFLLAFAIAVVAMATVRHAAGIKVDINTHQPVSEKEKNNMFANVEEVDWGSYDSSVLDPSNNSEEDISDITPDDSGDESDSGIEMATMDEDSIEQERIDSIEKASMIQVEEETTFINSSTTTHW